MVKSITERDRIKYNSVVSHPLQAYEWGEFREKTGIKVIRRGFYKNGKLDSAFQLTIHPIPHTSFTIGYLPKGETPTDAMINELRKIGEDERCIFIQLEPNIQVESGKMKDEKLPLISHLSSIISLRPAAHPLFTKYNFVLDLTKSEEELLKQMHQKARYNIKVAKKYEVTVTEDNDQSAFNEYLKLTEQTTRRQKFFAHTLNYHRAMWEALNAQSLVVGPQSLDKNKLSAHLLIAKYSPKTKDQRPKTLTSWILFVFKDTLYYPYGASSSEHREVMASNLVMWEAIRFGKKLGLKKFDMWGALGPNPDPKDPWIGFHTFKEKYGPEHVEYVGSYDLVINPILYSAYKVADKLRWAILRIKK
jgi:lipid II:glycine glycyltransferase (peptidoglycan interpeptide bridge formation enzyme)